MRAPFLLVDQVIKLAFGHLAKGLVSDSSKLAIQIVVVLVLDVPFEVVAGYGLIGIEDDLDGVVDGSAVGD